jgi:hypothetical protein
MVSPDSQWHSVPAVRQKLHLSSCTDFRDRLSPAEGWFWSGFHSDGRKWSLYYQQWFGTGPQHFTISRARKPDFVLVAFTGTRLERWVLLDAKYRTEESSIHEALASMHVYRDSLRWYCSEVGKEQAACAGYLLVPDVHEKLIRFSESEYLARWRLGLVRIDDDLIAQKILNH